MSQRDELAREVFIADNSSSPDPAAEWTLANSADRRSLVGSEYAFNIADGLLAAGYRKPRTITTVDELDALPVRSVVLCTGNRMAMSVTKRTNDEPAGLDYFTAGNPMGYAVGEVPLPATVLYEPEAPHAH